MIRRGGGVAWWFGMMAATLPAQEAQAPPQPLSLAVVLQRSREFARELPRVLWWPGGHGASVVATAADGSQSLHRFGEQGVEAEPLWTAAALLAAIGKDPGKGPARFPALRWLDAGTLRVELDDRVLHVPSARDAAPATVLAWPVDPPARGGEAVPPAIAPGDGHVAHLREHQLWLTDRAGRGRQLTFDGGPDIAYGTAAHRAEFGIQRGLFWSADGRFLAFTREDLRPIAPYPYQDLGASPPAPAHGRYPMAGQPHARVRVGVCDTEGPTIHWLEHDPAEDVYWTNLAFDGDGHVVVARVNRGQDHLELVRYDARSGRRLQTLLEEHDAEWIEPEQPPVFLADGRFLWWSSRSGHRHLWLCDPDGTVRHAVTKGAFDVQRLLGVADDGRTVWFEASGEDPRQRHVFAAALDGSEVRQVTRERGTHRAELSPDGAVASVVWSNLETPPSARLLDLRSGAVTPLPALPDPLAAFALPTQRMFQVKTDDDVVLYGHVALPPDLAEGQRCPVLLYVYGGPHVQLVTDAWLGGAPLWLQALAAEGYVVCRLDNRGTPHRGIDFEQAVHRRLGVLEVQDQLRAVEWLQQQPFVDKERIGVHGWSYGGYLTLRLLLSAPQTFACGVSGAPVTDWALYETGYTERYMDLPAENPAGYAASSCLPLVERLQRPLLLVHGTDDRTVVWAHSLRFVERCVQAGKLVDYMPYPMQQHGLVGVPQAHFLRLLRDWLGRHLRPEARG
ncbi:MAG: DPP IV N-terminal domain-containing protein [Planctomycetes bacterium]|nr:DPP IV N-terminal domain-containing protein [Planctomycetota bacterium]